MEEKAAIEQSESLTLSSDSCPICLASMLQVSYLDKCLHKFCFDCILRWTKVVASKHRSPTSSVKCPLCKTENFSIIFGVDGSSFQRHYVNQDFEDSFILSRAHRYRLQCYYTEQGFLDDIFSILQYWKSRKYYQPNCWLQSWLRREIQALIQEEDVDIIVHHILGMVNASLTRRELKSHVNAPEKIQEEFKMSVSEAARPFLGARTDRFVYEIQLFLASGLNIEAYDAVYIQRLGWSSPGPNTEVSQSELIDRTTVIPYLYIFDDDSDGNEGTVAYIYHSKDPHQKVVENVSMERASDYGAFMEKFLLPPTSSPDAALPLNSLTFAVKDIFDIEGYVTGFGNPDWARTHPVATSTAPTVLALLTAGATCVGKTVMDEMAYSINGENIHYGTPRNPCAADRVPGGSSSGSAVAVGAMIVDFSIGTDTGGSVRVPASYCGILGFRPSHGAVSTSGVIPMAQTFDTVGWFARDPTILRRVGRVLLQLPELAPVRPTCIIVAEDCFQLSSIPYDLVQGIVVKAVEKLYGGDVLKYEILGEYVKTNVPSLKHFISKENTDQVYNIPSLAALSSAMRLLQRYEFKNNHGEWVTEVKPDLGPGISERVSDALRTTGENIDLCHSIKQELHDALTALLGDFGVLMIPTVPGPPPKLQTNSSELEIFRARAFSLLSIVGVSGFCQVSIPLPMYNDLPISISLVARHGADGFLLHLVESFYDSIKEEEAAWPRA